MNLERKNILVTAGAGIGVGAGACEVIAQAGGRLFINDRDEERLRETVRRYPGSVALPGDVSRAEDVDRVFAEAARHGEPITGLVNNAGVGLVKPVHEVTEEQFDRLYGVDVRGTWLMTRAFVRQLLGYQLPGSIVNVSSVIAKAPIKNYTVYASAKAAVEGLTRGLAVELGPHSIRANVVAPGYVHAEQNYDLIRTWTDDPDGWIHDFIHNQQALSYECTARDCGQVITFLLSDESRSVTGQTIYVDCGLTTMLVSKDRT